MRDLTYSFNTAISGNVSLSVTCTTNTIYISSVAAGTSTVDVALGFYVVRAADTVAKVVVK